MPRNSKSKSKSRTRRKISWKARGANQQGRVSANAVNSISRSVGVPQCWNLKLRYCDRVVVDTTHQGVGESLFIYRLNGAFDPQQATGGHQPMYYDAMAGIYNEYLVTGCRATLTVTQDNVHDNPTVVFWGVKDTVTINNIPTVRNTMEQGDRTIMNLGFAAAGGATKTMTQYTDIAKTHGVKGKLTPKNTAFTARVAETVPLDGTAVPKEQAFGILQFFAADGQADVNVIFNITLDYTICFFNRKDQREN